MKIGSFLIRRFINGVLAFFLILLTISAVLNIQLEITGRGIIDQIIDSFLLSEASCEIHPDELAQVLKEMKKGLEKSYGLDENYFIRTFNTALRFFLLDFGQSRSIQTLAGSKKIRDIIMEGLPNTLILLVTTTVISIIISIILGVKKAQKFNSLFDKSTSMLTMLFYGTPSWWIGMIFIYIFAIRFDILPFGSMYSSPPPTGEIALFFDRLWHMILPVTAVVTVRFWGGAYITKSILLDTLQQDYIAAVRGRGLPERKVLFGHALRASSPAILTMSIMSIISSFGGDILLEVILAWPGLGWQLWRAINQQDLAVTLGISTMIALIHCIALFFLDVSYIFLDPKIKY